jgi:S-adenosylmethionine-diacylglycerol 3-amino-3-carboxypropyl transferase
MNTIRKTKPNPVANFVFDRVHRNNLIYNTCWEDPRCDRALMDFDEDSEIVMITSAGCNALEYLLDQPKAIHCIDVNPRQNALLELKKAAIKNLDWGDLFLLFGKGVFPKFKEVLKTKLQQDVSPENYSYWQRKSHYFNGKGIRKNFYHHGTTGAFAWITSRFFGAKKDLFQQVKKVFASRDIEEQIENYHELEEKFLNRIFKSLLNNHFIMSMLGVPKNQQNLARNEMKPELADYIHHSLNRVFTQLPARENYFYRVYAFGTYEPNCCPEYLKVDNKVFLESAVDKIQIHTNTISDFLKKYPGQYSHYILLDHQDWLSQHNLEALEEEWRLILKNSKPGTKILLRSAASKVDFFPDFVLEAVDFETRETAHQHQLDRVGTYASVYLAIVK